MKPPFDRLIAQRADPIELRRFIRSFDRRLEVEWSDEAIGRYDIQDGEVEIHLGPELARDGERTRYLATVHSIYEGTFAEILDIRCGPARDDDEGMCELGPVISYGMEFYDFGADLAALRDAGVRLSWEAAQWLYAVGRDALAELHATGHVHDGSPRQIRLGLFHRPYTPSKQQPGRYLGTNAASSGEVEHPPAFVFAGGTREGSDPGRAADRAMLAFAVAGLTRHPDPHVDRLLRDPSPDAADVLRDLLLERARPIEPLLRDRANTTDLDNAPLIDLDSLDDEFEALWNKVLELDPMIDTSDPAVFSLPAPYIESIHGKP